MNELDKLIASDIDAREFGFDWPNQAMIIEWIISECKETLAAIEDKESSDRIQEEIGYIIHSAVSLCLFSGFNVQETMQKSTDKFNTRMHWLKEFTKKRGLPNLHGQDMELMLQIWREAKKAS